MLQQFLNICSDEFFKSVWKLTSDKVKQKILGQSILYTYKCSHSAPQRIFNYIYGMHHQSFFWKLEFLLFKTSQTVLTFGIDGFLNSALYVERSSKNLRSDRLCVAAPHTWRQKILGQKFLIVKGFP